MNGCADDLPPGSGTFPCITEACGIAISQQWDPKRQTWCPQIGVRVSTITNPQGNGQAPLTQLLSCFTPIYDMNGAAITTGATAGLMTAFRPTPCFAVAAVRDENGVLAGEINFTPWVVPPVPTGQELTCPAIVNVAQCIPSVTTSEGVVTPGGMGALLKTSKSIKVDLVTVSTCTAGGSQTVSAASMSLVLDPCQANAINQGDNGIYAIVAASDCISMTVESVDTGSTTGVCGSISKVVRSRPILANTADNAMSCTPLGQGVFAGPSESLCFTTSVRTQTIGGLEYKTLVGNVNLVQADDQLMQCVNGQGMGVFFYPCGAGIKLVSTTRVGGTGVAFRADLVLNQHSNNILSISAGAGDCLESLHAGVNLNSTCMNWTITTDPGGGNMLDACVKLSTATCGTAGNGLVQKSDGLWAPPDIHVGYWNAHNDDHPSFPSGGPGTGSGAAGPALNVSGTNCDSCRCALMCVIARAPACELQTENVAGNQALLEYSGTINGTGYGQHWSAGHWQLGTGHAHRAVYPGMTELHWFVVPPGGTIAASLTPAYNVIGGSGQISGYRLDIISFPMGMSAASPACGQCS